MDKRGSLALVAVIILGLAGIIYIAIHNNAFSSFSESSQTTSGNSIEPVHLYALENQEAISNLPDEAKINIKTYNFDSGERQWEKSYRVSKGRVVEGLYSESDVDLSIVIHSKYLKESEDSDFCELVGQAKANGDLGIETEKSKLALLSKYGSFSLKYKNCLEA